MDTEKKRGSNLPVSVNLPRGIYAVIVGLAVWLVASVWGFAGSGTTGLALGVVSVFIAIAVGLPLLLALIERRHRRHRSGDEPAPLTDWLGREFDTHTGRLSGSTAAIQILLPIAAVAFGMTLFAVVRHLGLTI